MNTCCNRRAFLGASAVGVSALALTGCGTENKPDEQSRQWVSLPLTEPLEVGGSVSVAHQEEQILLHRPDEEQVLAFSAVCPHQGCTVGIEDDRFECPCHGSRFTLTGEWQSGPANQPLQQYEAGSDGENAVRVLL